MANPTSTSTRRDSRIHLQLRHSDALQEQEAWRRKYLLINKHITKLNAGLNMRVEELNVQITQLNSENIALRSKVLELTGKLAAEQATTRRAAAEAEILTANAIRQLAALKDAFAGLAVPVVPVAAELPNSGPREPVTRTALAKKPEVSFIREATIEVEDIPVSRTTTSAAFPQPSSSDPPPPSSSSTPSPPSATAFVTSRRAPRRPVKVELEPEPAIHAPTAVPKPTPRPAPRPVPAVPPIEVEVVSSEAEVEEELVPPAASSSKGGTKERPRVGVGLARQRSPMDEPMPSVGTSSARRKTVDKENDLDALREESGEESHRTAVPRKPAKRRPSTPPPPLPASSIEVPARPSEDWTDVDSDAGVGEPLRERRVRKSVNYAEPKLNTKMRKPENLEASTRISHSTPRVSMSGSASSRTPTASLAKKAPPPEGQQQTEGEQTDRSEDEGVTLAAALAARKTSKARRHTMGP